MLRRINENKILSKYTQPEPYCVDYCSATPNQRLEPKLFRVSPAQNKRDVKLLSVPIQQRAQPSKLKMLSVRQCTRPRSDILLKVPLHVPPQIELKEQGNQTQFLLPPPVQPIQRKSTSKCVVENRRYIPVEATDSVEYSIAPKSRIIVENEAQPAKQAEASKLQTETATQSIAASPKMTSNTSSNNVKEESSTTEVVTQYVSKIHSFVVQDLKPLYNITQQERIYDDAFQKTRIPEEEHIKSQKEHEVAFTAEQAQREDKVLESASTQTLETTKTPKSLPLISIDETYREYLERHGLFLPLMPATSKVVENLSKTPLIVSMEEQSPSISSSIAIADIFNSETPSKPEEPEVKSVLRNKLSEFMSQKSLRK